MAHRKSHTIGRYTAATGGKMILILVSQYWVVYAFLTVIESMINASYWFPFYYTFKFVFIMYMALPQTQ